MRSGGRAAARHRNPGPTSRPGFSFSGWPGIGVCRDGASTGAPHDHRIPDFQQFIKQRADIALAYVNGDAAPLDAIATLCAPVAFFPPGGGHVDGVTNNYLEGAGRFAAGGDSQLEVLQSQDSGDLAYWVGLQRARVRVKGKPDPVAMDLRVAEVFRRDEGGWRLVHRHADMLAEPHAKPAG